MTWLLLAAGGRGGRVGGGRGGYAFPADHATHWLGIVIVIVAVAFAIYVAYGHRLRRHKGPPRYRGHGKWR